jgi:hypothetical protein
LSDGASGEYVKRTDVAQEVGGGRVTCRAVECARAGYAPGVDWFVYCPFGLSDSPPGGWLCCSKKN